MAQTILVTPEQLRAEADKLKNFTREDEEIFRRLTNLVLSLDEVWKGEAQTAFVQQFQSARSQFSAFHQTLISFSEMMQKTAQNLEETDNSLRQHINAIQ